jgi:hypothetical protein
MSHLDLKADVIDTRNIINRLEEIESGYVGDEGDMAGYLNWSPDDQREWTGLARIIEEVGDEARHGVALVHEAHFATYIRDEYLDMDPGLYEYKSQSGNRTWDLEYVGIPADELYGRLPFARIDWQAVADDHRSDYSQLTIDGVTYLYRAA